MQTTSKQLEQNLLKPISKFWATVLVVIVGITAGTFSVFSGFAAMERIVYMAKEPRDWITILGVSAFLFGSIGGPLLCGKWMVFTNKCMPMLELKKNNENDRHDFMVIGIYSLCGLTGIALGTILTKAVWY